MESCRLCLRKRKNMLSIFGESEESVRLHRYILDCCPIQLIRHENLPAHICTECRLKLNTVYKFRDQCRLSDRRLRCSYPKAFENSTPEKEEYNKQPYKVNKIRERITVSVEKCEEVRDEVDRDESDIEDSASTEPKEQRYLCDICSKTFASKSGLRFHLKSHNGVKPYSCRYCDKRFAIPSYKKRHERVHMGDKRFVCHVCSAAFASSNGLKYHLSRHTGEGNYRCDTCGKSFHRYKYLKEHVFTHTGERPFVCKVCTSAYSNSGSLFVHEKKCKARHERGDLSNGVQVATVEKSFVKANCLSQALGT